MNQRTVALHVLLITVGVFFLPSAVIAQQVAPPVFLPDGNLYNLEQLVQVTCATVGATINYTTNGVDPTSSDPVVVSGSSILIDHPLLLKAIAFKSGLTPSAVKSANYSIVGKLAAGQNHSLAVKTDGSLLSWGKNVNGQLGYGTTGTGAFSIPFPVKKNSTTTFTGVVTAAGGGAHSAAVKTDGTVWAWGLNASGQLGDSTVTQRLYPVQCKLSSGVFLTGYKDIACGSDHTVALKSDGTVWAWGLNSSGQVGNGTTTTPQKNAVQVKTNSTTFLTGIIAIAAGDTHSLVLKSDGTVWAWGLNSSGQIGNGTTTNQTFAVQVKLVGGAALTSIVDLAAGAKHSLALKSDGSLWAWGSNASGQLADGTTVPTSSSKQINAVQVKTSASTYLTSVAAVAGGNSHTLALKTDGTLWSWGLNSSGQLGNNTTTLQVFPVQVKDVSGNFFTGVVDLFAGASHSLGSKATGTIWGWGLNSSGQAGALSSTFNPPTATDIKNGSKDVLIIWGLEDPDLDTLLNWQERALGTNTNLADTDGDGLRDDYEVLHSLNPLVNDAGLDPDADGLTNAQEYAAGTDPHLADTDFDLAKDGEDIYPLDPHFALKKTPTPTYAVIEVTNDAYLVRGKINNFNSVIYSKNSGTFLYLPNSWLWTGGTPLYLPPLDEPVPPPPPNTLPDAQKYYIGANDINDNGQIVGYSSYDYPVDFTGSNQIQLSRRMSHAVIGTGGTFKDLGDGTIDNGVNDQTGAPTIDGTNKGDSSAVAINTLGTIVGGADFYVDVTPPSPPNTWSTVTSGSSDDAQFGAGPPAIRTAFGGVTITGINTTGDICSWSSISYTAKLWSGGVLQDLGTIPGYPYSGSTYAFTLNDSKYVGGAEYSFNNSRDNRIPFVWHENIRTGGDPKMLQLPVLPNTQQSEVLAINKDGVMIGYSYSFTTGALTGALWQNGLCYNPNSGRLNAAAISAGWNVTGLRDINDHGVILASAARSGYNGLVLLVPDPAVQLITPSGDPVNAPVDTAVDGQNEFTFSTANPGVLNVHLKAKVLATGTAAALVSRCQFTIDDIGGVAPAWASGNPNGQPVNTTGDFLEADALFTGLPANNSDFGRKTVTIKVDGAVADQKVMEVFFSRDESNHPGGQVGTPNWFYYWQQTVQPLGPNPRIFYYASGVNKYDSPTNEIRIVDSTVGSYTAPYAVNNPLIGIDHFAWTFIHESQHYADWAAFWDVDNSGITKWQAAAGQSGPNDDYDSDVLPNHVEDVNLNGSYDTGDLSNWQIFNTPDPGRSPQILSDNEEWNCRRHTEVTGDHAQDWADPGTQH